MTQAQKLKRNSLTFFAHRIVLIISGLILPKFILLHYGSAINGLVASVTQFLSIITFLDLGVGSVVQSALYKPIVDNNQYQINAILTSANRYFKRIAYSLLFYVIVLSFIFPLMVDDYFDVGSTIFLIIALSLSHFGQFYFGITNALFLNATQNGYVQARADIVVIILNLIANIFLIQLGFSIQLVKLVSGFLFLLRPLFLWWYVKRNYEIDFHQSLKTDPLPQRWHGMGQHIAFSINESTDVVILTLFSTLQNVSIYSIYNLVIQAIRGLISSVSVGFNSFFGNLLAKEEQKLLNNYFDVIELLSHNTVTFIYGMTGLLINDFILIYTSGVEDINYYAPIFSSLLVLSASAHSLRIPYQSLIFSAGHFKQTQKSSFIEALLNIIISVVFVYKFGLSGVAIGTLVAMGYRTLFLVYYLSQNILHRSTLNFFKLMLLNVTIFSGMFISHSFLNTFFVINNIFEWLIYSLILSSISLIIIFILNYIFFKELVFKIINRDINLKDYN